MHTLREVPLLLETHSSRASTDQLCASKHVLVAGQRLLKVIHRLQLISIVPGIGTGPEAGNYGIGVSQAQHYWHLGPDHSL